MKSKFHSSMKEKSAGFAQVTLTCNLHDSRMPIIITFFLAFALFACSKPESQIKGDSSQEDSLANNTKGFKLDTLKPYSSARTDTVDFGCGMHFYFDDTMKQNSSLRENPLFSFNYLADSSIKYVPFDPDWDGRLISRTRIRANTESENEILIYQYDSNLKIKTYSKTGYLHEDSGDKTDLYSKDSPYIIIKGQYFSVDSLYDGEERNGSISILAGISDTGLLAAYKFIFNGSLYYLFMPGFIGGNNRAVDHRPILIKVPDQGPVKLLSMPDVYQSSSGPFCISDFDRDGTLDYLNANLHRDNDTLSLYSFNEDGSYVKREYFLILSESGSCSIGFPTLNMKASNWPFQLTRYRSK